MTRVFSALLVARLGLIFVAFGTLWLLSSVWLRGVSLRTWAGMLARAGLRLGGIRVQSEWSSENLPNQPVVFVCNHVSLIDPFVCLAALGDHPLTALMFDGYRHMPLWGRLSRRFGLIAVNNHSVASAKQALDAAAASLRRGISVFVMPEGKRTEDGQLGSFRAGAALLAARAAVDIQPMVQLHECDVMRPGRYRSGTIRVLVGERIPSSQVITDGPKATMQAARAQIAALLSSGGETKPA